MRSPKCRIAIALGLVLMGEVSATAQQIPMWSLVSPTTIGASHGFTSIMGVFPLSDGSIVVADQGNRSVDVFGRSGAHIAKIGREGRGPGEYGLLSNVGVVGDTIWILDSAITSTPFFSPSGDLLKTAPRTRPGVTAMVADGALGLVTPKAPPSSEALDPPRRAIVAMTRSGEVRDTIAWMATRHTTFAIGPTSRGGFTVTRQRFSDAEFYKLGHGGNVIFVINRAVPSSSQNASFTVTALKRTGGVLWKRSYPYAPVSLPQSKADSLLKALTALGTADGISAADVRAAAFVPRFYPPITSAAVATDGSLWLGREEGRSVIDYLVLNAAGQPIGQLAVSANKSVVAATATEVYIVERDEFDVPALTRYSIRR